MSVKGAAQFFVEANWLHNTKTFGVSMDNQVVHQKGAKNIGEVKIGGEGKVTKAVHVWANVGAQFGSQSYKVLTGMIGVKYVF